MFDFKDGDSITFQFDSSMIYDGMLFKSDGIMYLYNNAGYGKLTKTKAYWNSRYVINSNVNTENYNGHITIISHKGKLLQPKAKVFTYKEGDYISGMQDGDIPFTGKITYYEDVLYILTNDLHGNTNDINKQGYKYAYMARSLGSPNYNGRISNVKVMDAPNNKVFTWNDGDTILFNNCSYGERIRGTIYNTRQVIYDIHIKDCHFASGRESSCLVGPFNPQHDFGKATYTGNLMYVEIIPKEERKLKPQGKHYTVFDNIEEPTNNQKQEEVTMILSQVQEKVVAEIFTESKDLMVVRDNMEFNDPFIMALVWKQNKAAILEEAKKRKKATEPTKADELADMITGAVADGM